MTSESTCTNSMANNTNCGSEHTGLRVDGARILRLSTLFNLIQLDIALLAVLVSSLDNEIASQHPLLTSCHLFALMQHAVIMIVQ